jgi:uncharacterized membrane protein
MCHDILTGLAKGAFAGVVLPLWFMMGLTQWPWMVMAILSAVILLLQFIRDLRDICG